MKKDCLIGFTLLLIYCCFAMSLVCAQCVWDTCKVSSAPIPAFDLSDIADQHNLASEGHADQDLDLLPCEDDFDDELFVEFFGIEIPSVKYNLKKRIFQKYSIVTRFLEAITPPPPNSCLV